MSVISLALSPVNIKHVIYKVEHVWIVNMECMVPIVTCRAHPTVRTAHAIQKMEHALHVSLGSGDYIVKQVRFRILSVIRI